MEEIRKHNRYHCEHPLWIKPYAIVDGEYQLAEVHNISAGGAYFICQGPLRVNQVLELCMEVPGEYRMLSLRGPVRHLRMRNGICRVGMAFDEVSDMTSRSFCSYIEHTFAAERAEV